MKFSVRLLFVLTLLLAGSLTAMAQSDQLEWEKQDGRWVGKMVWKTDVGKGGSVDAHGLIGGVEYLGGEAKKATFEIEFYADRDADREEAMEQADEYFPMLKERKGSVSLRMSKRHSWRRSWGGDDENYSVNIVAKLPTEFNISSGSAAGGVSARGLKGDVELSTGGGGIDVLNCEGYIELSTGGGSIDVENVQGDISISTGGGGISIYDSESDRRARLSTGGGGIDIRDCTGYFSATTGAGGVDVRDHTGPLKLNTGAGSIDVSMIEGEINANTGTGSIDLEIEKPSKSASEIELSTGIGSIDVILPADIEANVYAESHGARSTRQIRSDFDLDIDVDRHEVIRARGEINGGGVPIRLESGRGRISIRKR